MEILPLRAWAETEKRKYAAEDCVRTAQSLTILIVSWLVTIVLSTAAARVIAQLVRQKQITLENMRSIVLFCIALVGIALSCVIYGRLRQYSKWYGQLLILQIANGVYALLSCFVPLPQPVLSAASLVLTLVTAWLFIQAMGQQLRDIRAPGEIQAFGERYFHWTIRYVGFKAGVLVAQAVTFFLTGEMAGVFRMIGGFLDFAAFICSIGWLVQYVRYVLRARKHFLTATAPKGTKRTAK